MILRDVRGCSNRCIVDFRQNSFWYCEGSFTKKLLEVSGTVVPPTGIEPVPSPPEGDALSAELRGRIVDSDIIAISISPRKGFSLVNVGKIG